MLLAEIEATNFRNLSGRIVWGPKLNIIYGNNGQGKTNWLEAIYVLARTKSFRTQRLQEAIRFGEQIAVVRGKVTSAKAATLGSSSDGETRSTDISAMAPRNGSIRRRSGSRPATSRTAR